MQSRGQLGSQRGRGSREALVGGRRGHQLEHCLQPLPRCALTIHLVADEQHLESGSTPVQLAQHRLQLGFRARRHMHDDHAAQLADRLDRIGNVEACRRAVRSSATTGRTRPRPSVRARLGGIGEVAHVPTHVGPHCGRRIAAVRLHQQQDQPAFYRGNEPALNREPALTKLLRVARTGEDGPQGCVVARLVAGARSRSPLLPVCSLTPCFRIPRT